MSWSQRRRVGRGDDWEGLYVDGELATEGHQLIIEDLADVLGIEIEDKYANIDWLEERGSLPNKLEDVKFE